MDRFPFQSIKTEESMDSFEKITSSVGEKLYYRNPICWAVRAGVALGIGPEIFGPDRTLTRAQALSFLFRALNF